MAALELHALLLCDYALTAQDGKLSAVGIFSQINVATVPAVHGRFFVVAVLEADQGRHDIQIQVISPAGTPLLPDPPRMQIDVPAATTTANIVAELNGLEVRELGRHRLELRSGDRLLGSAPFSVNLVWRPEQAAKA